jgi:DNA-directed RNA polymerase sigma subunit (sigma70/sigma32)
MPTATKKKPVVKTAKKTVSKAAKKPVAKKPVKAVKKSVKTVKKAPVKTAKKPIAKAPKKVVSKAAAKVMTPAQKAKAKVTNERDHKAEMLIKKGKERGYITYSEILKEFPHVENDVSFLDDLYERFTISGIDILEGGMLEDNADEYLASRNIKGRDSAGYDSIQIYLREIGQYPLLTAAEERDLAQRIETFSRSHTFGPHPGRKPRPAQSR